MIPSDAPAVYGVVNRYLLPLAVPLLLFSADLRYVPLPLCRPAARALLTAKSRAVHRAATRHAELKSCKTRRRRVLTSTGRLLVIFAAGSVGTVIGTLVAAKVMPLQTLGSDAWKVLARQPR